MSELIPIEKNKEKDNSTDIRNEEKGIGKSLGHWKAVKSRILWIDDDECHKTHTIDNNKREEVLEGNIQKKEYQKEYTRHNECERIKK